MRFNIGIPAAVAAMVFGGVTHATNGYFTDGVGTKNKGLVGAGSADPEEVMILATNPAGLTYVSERLAVGLELFSPDRSYSTSASLANGGCSPMGCAFTVGPNSITSDNRLFEIPYVAYRWQLDPDDTLAAAFYGRGGMNTKWVGGTASFTPGGPGTPPMTFPGTYGDGTAGVDLMQGFLNLSGAHTFADRTFSIGASLIFAMQRFEARGVGTFAPYTITFAQSGGTVMPTHLSDNGHEMSYGGGASLGVQWRPDPRFAASLAYTSKMYMSRFTRYSDLFAEGGKFNIPASATLGVTFKPIEPVAVSFDVQKMWYSGIASVGNPISNLFRCPTAGAGGTDVQSCLGGSRGAGFGWGDMTVYKLGLRGKLSGEWMGRFGVSHGTQPIPGSQTTFNILAPGVMENHIAVGVTHRSSEGEFNAAFTFAPSKSIRGVNTFDPTQTIELKMHQVDFEFGYAWVH